MLILGIDPGTAIVGYGLIESTGNKHRYVAHGAIRTAAGLPLADRLLVIYRELNALLDQYKPDHVAVEELFFSRNAKTAISVGQARGVILLAVAQRYLPLFEYKPLEVKQALVGYGGADKSQIQQFLRMMFGFEEVPKPDDAADAIAIAVCHANSYKLKQLIAQSGQHP